MKPTLQPSVRSRGLTFRQKLYGLCTVLLALTVLTGEGGNAVLRDVASLFARYSDAAEEQGIAAAIQDDLLIAGAAGHRLRHTGNQTAAETVQSHLD